MSRKCPEKNLKIIAIDSPNFGQIIAYFIGRLIFCSSKNGFVKFSIQLIIFDTNRFDSAYVSMRKFMMIQFVVIFIKEVSVKIFFIEFIVVNQT